MEIELFRERANVREHIAFHGSTVAELLAQIKINPETVIVVRNKEVLTADIALYDKDVISLLSVVSGG